MFGKNTRIAILSCLLSATLVVNMLVLLHEQRTVFVNQLPEVERGPFVRFINQLPILGPNDIFLYNGGPYKIVGDSLDDDFVDNDTWAQSPRPSRCEISYPDSMEEKYFLFQRVELLQNGSSTWRYYQENYFSLEYHGQQNAAYVREKQAELKQWALMQQDNLGHWLCGCGKQLCTCPKESNKESFAAEGI